MSKFRNAVNSKQERSVSGHPKAGVKEVKDKGEKGEKDAGEKN